MENAQVLSRSLFPSFIAMTSHVARLLTLIILVALPFTLKAQVDFSVDTTSGCAPVVLNFTSTAPGASSIFWDFGDNTNSTLPNPGKIYTQPGTYTVTLTATFTVGAPVVITKAAYINVYTSPTADFTTATRQVCWGTPIAFTDNSSPGTGSIVSWLWNFGDGLTSTQQNPTHTYVSAGIFNVSLQVTDVNGCTDVLTKSTFIRIDKPNASFSFNNVFGCNPPLNVQFTSTGTTAGNHTWLFGAAGTSVQASPSVTFTTAGVYTITHIVTDPNGCSDTVIYNNLVQVGQTNVQVLVSKRRICVGETVQFFCGSSVASNISWNFGAAGTRTICDPMITYFSPGIYTANLTLTYPNGCTVNGSTTVTVVPPPSVLIGPLNTIACSPPLTINFTSTVGNAPAGSRYHWTFGDGDTSNLTNPTHTYTQNGIFAVSLHVITPDGCEFTRIISSMVVIGGLNANFGAVPLRGCLPLDVQFSSLSSSIGPITSYDWSFGDGGTSTAINPLHTYMNRGLYSVKLVVSNSRGCLDSLTKSNYIAVGDTVVADFVPKDSVFCGQDLLAFTDSSKGVITRRDWAFGDGGASSAQDPTYQYTDTGYFDVTLIVSDNGCSDTLMVDSAVYINPVIAYVIGNFVGCDTPFVADFFNASLGGDTWHWDFDTGNPADTSNVKSPQFTYTQTGDYLVTLIAFDSRTGCPDTIEQLVQVELIDIWAGVDTTFGCVPHTSNFTGGSNFATTKLWSFGDGSASNNYNIGHTYTRPGNFRPRLTVWNRIGCQLDTMLRVSAYKPIVDFLVADSNGCAPYAPVWTNSSQSLLPVAIWDWTLGNGTTSSTRIPLTSYGAGHYTVNLVVTDVLGCTDSMRWTDYIYVNDPRAIINAADSVSCIGQGLFFQSASTGQSLLGSGWDFGDMTTSNQPSVNHTYINNGNYTVSLTVIDSLGCQDVATLPVIIADPSVSIQANTTFGTCPPLSVNFTGIANSPHSYVRWEWDFGDGNTSISQNPSNLYTQPGVYTVKLKGITSTGCEDSTTIVDLITVLGPDGSMTFGPLTGCPGTTVTFAVVDSNTVSSVCDFGDGALAQGTPKLSNFSHTYTTSGIYKPILVLDDGKGCQFPIFSQDSIIIYPLPQIDFTASQTSLCDTGTVQFTNLSISTAPIQSQLWKFGDGQTSSVLNPRHFYAQPDSYQVTLIITTIDGCVDSLVLPAFIIGRELPIVGMTLSDTSGCQPFNLRLSDNSPATNATLTTWEWKSGYAGGQASGANVQFNYPVSGFYTLNLAVTDIFGCQNDLDSTIHVLPLPVVDFGVLPDSFSCAPVVLQFRDRVRSGVSWRWDFGDGNTSLQQDPQYEYTLDGAYDVKLVITDSRGCMDSLTKSTFIRLSHPEANFTFAPDEGCPPLLVDFTDITLSDTSISNWQWSFGDANSGFSANPQHLYALPGVYTVRLIVNDAFGCADTILKENIIRVLEDIQPNPPQIRRVTVVSDSEARVEWESFVNPNNDFGRYEIYRENGAGNWAQVYSTNDISLTYFDDTGLSTQNQSYCYKLLIVNNCENASLLDSSITHCTVLLSTSSAPESIQLDWSAYVGFEVATYKVYRVANYALSSTELIATVGPQTLSYIDTDMFCYDQVTYRILADKVGENLLSYSNISANVPIHQIPTEQEDLVRATVAENQWIKVEWKDVGVDQAATLVLERNEGAGYRNLVRLPVDQVGNSFRDDNVNVNDRPYLYRAYWVDSCGDRTDFGLPGSSIHLTAERRQGTVFLDWTSYKRWQGGVATYQVELFDEAAESFIPVAQVQPTDSGYIDRRTEIQQGEYCYRIRAFERGGNDTVSISNEACVRIFPQLYAPNAFSPNGDAINEEFLIKGAYLQTFNLRIFTRWGYQIFESKDQNQGWNGKYREADSPEGAYVFVVEAIGLDGSPVHLRGTVTLIR